MNTMATGVPLASGSEDRKSNDLSNTSARRHSMVFRSSRHSSSSGEDDNDEFSADFKEMRQRRFSMDQNRFRKLQPPRSATLDAQRTRPTSALDPNCSASNDINSSSFVVPSPVSSKKLSSSRPNSPFNSLVRPIALASRHRLATIRRESDCSTENEMAHEKLVKTSQQVSTGFEDFCLDERLHEERKRTKSLAEPISVFTNAFLPLSSSPSPTRANVDAQKQCYSPSTQQVVRSNISYSPSPSPTPASPTRSRIMRSMSPIAVRQISKRRYTTTGSVSGMESDSESSVGPSSSVKRQCLVVRGAASPLVRDSVSAQNIDSLSDNLRSSSPLSVCSNYSNPFRPRVATSVQNDHGSSIDSDDNGMNEDEQQYFMAGTNGSSTAFSSRAETPIEEDGEASSTNNARSSPYGIQINGNFGLVARDTSLPPPSPLASKAASISAHEPVSSNSME